MILTFKYYGGAAEHIAAISFKSFDEIRSIEPEARIKDRDKLLHHAVSVGCNYLSLPLILDSGATLLIDLSCPNQQI